MKQIYLSKCINNLEDTLTFNLPGSPLKKSRAWVDKAYVDALDIERIPFQITTSQSVPWHKINITGWRDLDLYGGMRRYQYPRYVLRNLVLSYLDYLFEHSDTITPLYEIYNCKPEIIDIKCSRAHPKEYYSWDKLGCDIIEKENGNLANIRRHLLNWTSGYYGSSIHPKEKVNGSRYGYGEYGSHVASALPESLCFLYMLHTLLTGLLDPKRMESFFSPTWSPVKTPAYEFQLFIYNKYRVSYLKGRAGWRIVKL